MSLFKKKKDQEKSGLSSVKFDIETMEGDLDKPFQRKNLEIKNSQGESFGDKKKKDPSDKKKGAPPAKKPTTSPSPFLTEKVAEVPDKIYEKSDQMADKLRPGIGKRDNQDQKKDHSEKITPPENLPIEKKEKTSFTGVSFPDKEATKEKKEEKKEREIKKSKGVNKPLLFFALFVLLLTIGAGAYYYFFVINKPVDPIPAAPSLAEPVNPTPVEPIEPEPTEPEEISPEETTLAEEEPWQISPENFKAELKKIIEETKTDPEKLSALQTGSFVKLQVEDTDVSSSALLENMEIVLEDTDLYLQDEALLFLNKTVEEASPVKIALVFFVDPYANAEELLDLLKSKEENLPTTLLPLFVDEVAPTVSQTVAFQTSTLFSNVRYFNYQENQSNQSIDWGTFDYGDKKLLFFTTAMQSTQAILNALNNSEG